MNPLSLLLLAVAAESFMRGTSAPKTAAAGGAAPPPPIWSAPTTGLEVGKLSAAQRTRLSKLSQPMQEATVALMYSAAEEGVRLGVGSTKRTEAEQLEHYKAGRSKLKGPTAPHVRGAAVDFYVVEPDGTWDTGAADRASVRTWHRIAHRLGWKTLDADGWDPYHAEFKGGASVVGC